MEIADLIYVELLSALDGVCDVKYIYDLRTFDVGLSSGVIVYYMGERDRWFNIGSGKFYREERVAVEIIGKTKEEYSKIRDIVFGVFNGKSIVQDPAESVVDISSLVTGVENLSFYLDKVTVSDVSGLSEGERVYYGGGSGWIRWIDGLDLYILKAEGEFVLVMPEQVIDRSDRLKKMWRCLVNVVGKVIPVN